MRYRGQHYDIEVELPEVCKHLREALRTGFIQRYREIFHTSLDEPIEIVGCKVEASASAPQSFSTSPEDDNDGGEAMMGHRPAYFPAGGGLVDCPVLARSRLWPGMVVHGPALIEEAESTILLDAGDRAKVHGDMSLVAEIATP